MRDGQFQWSLSCCTVMVIAWIVIGTVFDVLPVAAVAIIGIAIELGLGGYLLHRWGKNYMERHE